MSMVTLKIEQQDGSIQDVEVSEDFMDLCNARANHIVNAFDINNEDMDRIKDLVEECTSNDSTKRIITNMVMHKLNRRYMMSLIEQAFNRLLGE